MTHLPHIMCRTILHSEQKYDTAGDYWRQGSRPDVWHIRISRMSDWRAEAAVFIHEFVEMCLTTHHGVDWNEIDFFDMAGPGKDSDDPGLLPTAPYHNEHMLATQIEKKFCKMIGLDWEEYQKMFENLEYKTGGH